MVFSRYQAGRFSLDAQWQFPDVSDPSLREEIAQQCSQMLCSSPMDLLLYDRCLVPVIELIVSDLPPSLPLSSDGLVGLLDSLSAEHLGLLMDWVVSPSAVSLRDHPVLERLGTRNKELSLLMGHPLARLTSLVELALAMAKSVPRHMRQSA